MEEKKLNLIFIIYYLFLVIIILSKELLSFRLVLGIQTYNVIIGIFIVFFLILSFFDFSDKKFKTRMLFFEKKRYLKYFNIVVWAFVFYLLIHEFIFTDGLRSIKLIVYFFILLAFSSREINLNMEKLAIVFVWVVFILALASILQVLLIAGIDKNDISGHRIYGSLETEFKRGDDIYRNPYLLGLVREESTVDFGPFEFRRANSYTTEPKFYSFILISGLIALFFLGMKGNVRMMQLVVLTLALFFSHAYSSLLVFGLAFCFIIFSRIKKIPSIYFGILILVFLIFALQFMTPFFISHSSGFAKLRFQAFSDIYEGIKNLPYKEVGAFGFGFDRPDLEKDIASIFLVFLRYGYIGLILYLSFFSLFIGMCVHGIREIKDFHNKVSLALAAGLLSTFGLLFMPEFITPLTAFFFSLCVHTFRRTI